MESFKIAIKLNRFNTFFLIGQERQYNNRDSDTSAALYFIHK